MILQVHVRTRMRIVRAIELRNCVLERGWTRNIYVRDREDMTLHGKSQRRLGSRGTKDHARSKLWPFHIKIIVCRSLNLAVGRLLKKKKKKKMEVWPVFV